MMLSRAEKRIDLSAYDKELSETIDLLRCLLRL